MCRSRKNKRRGLYPLSKGVLPIKRDSHVRYISIVTLGMRVRGECTRIHTHTHTHTHKTNTTHTLESSIRALSVKRRPSPLSRSKLRRGLYSPGDMGRLHLQNTQLGKYEHGWEDFWGNRFAPKGGMVEVMRLFQCYG